MELTAVQFLMQELNAPEFEDERDELTQSWICLCSIMDKYAEIKVSKLPIHSVSEELPQCNKSKWCDCECENECRRGYKK